MSSLPSDNRLLQDTREDSPRGQMALLLRWWYAKCAPPEVPESASFVVREQVRRGRVASFIILGTFIAALMLVPIIILAAPTMFFLPWAIASTVVGMLCCLAAIPLNRRGHIQPAGILLLIAVDVIVAGIVLSERNGLDPLFLSMFDLLVVSELIAASLLDPMSVFGVALLNTILIMFDINVQPRSMMWMQMVMSQQLAYSLLARPITLYFVVAAVAYLDSLVIDINRALMVKPVPADFSSSTTLPPVQMPRGENVMRVSPPKRPRDISKDTPLPDSSGFFNQQRPWPQLPQTPSYHPLAIKTLNAGKPKSTNAR